MTKQTTVLREASAISIPSRPAVQRAAQRRLGRSSGTRFQKFSRNIVVNVGG